MRNKAAIRAGYSAKTAAEIGHENLIKPHVAAEIEKARAKRAERTELTADWVVDPPPVGRRRIALVAPTAADAALIGHENLHCWCHAVDDVSLRSWVSGRQPEMGENGRKINQRGTAEQWIKEGKGAIKWTRLLLGVVIFLASVIGGLFR